MTGRSGGGDDGFELLGRADHRLSENMEADGRPGPEKQDVEESATHLFRVESSTPSRTDAFAIPIVYTASQLLQGSRYCSAVIHITSIGVATKQDSPHLWHQEGVII